MREAWRQWAANARTFQGMRAFDPAAEDLRCRDHGARVLSGAQLSDLLRSIPDPPALLYLRGTAPVSLRALAIVGSRTPSSYGRRMARRLAAACADAGVVVVSGLARGIDSEAHAAAVAAGGVTWAVLGSGLGRIYPPENEALAAAIEAAGGAILSEAPMLAPPAAAHFPRRNRIVSGLAMGVVVVEGGLTSGSMITARLAAEQGRAVFAVPGPAGAAMSAAPHRLLRQGACLAENWSDICSELPLLEASPLP